MNLSIVSVIALFLAIVLGFFKKSNVGIMCISFAFIISVIFGIKASDVIRGFSSSLALTMIGVTYLFSIINANKTLEIFANKLVRLVGKKTYLIYIAMYVVGFLICAVGPGAIPTLAIIPVLAVPVALSSGINPILLSVIGQIGVQSGRMTKINPEGILVIDLLEKQGLSDNLMPMMYSLIICELALLVFVFFYFKGWKFNKISVKSENEDIVSQNFNTNQIISLVGLVVLIICATVFNLNVGLTAFAIGSFLIILGVGKEQQSIKSIPWNIILLVLGVGVLMNIITISGGITLLSNGLQSVMGSKTASAIMTLVAGIMSFFSSGLGVVFPTLIPTATTIAGNLGGASAVELVASVVVGGTIAGYSPISTGGSLIMAAVSQEEEYKELYPENKIFIQLFAVAIAGVLISTLIALIGGYKLFC